MEMCIRDRVYAVGFGPDYEARGVTVVASGLQRPVGVAYRDGNLYVLSLIHI